MRFNPFKKDGVEMRHRDIDGYGLTDMGWEVHPRGPEKVLRYTSKLNVPLIITGKRHCNAQLVEEDRVYEKTYRRARKVH